MQKVKQSHSRKIFLLGHPVSRFWQKAKTTFGDTPLLKVNKLAKQ